MDVSVQSAAVKMTASTSSARPLPIYGDHDRITGSVKLATNIKPSSGRMSVSVRILLQSDCARSNLYLV